MYILSDVFKQVNEINIIYYQKLSNISQTGILYLIYTLYEII